MRSSLLGCYATWIGSSVIFSQANSRCGWLIVELVRDVSGQRIGPETSVTTYESMPCNIPEEGRSLNVELIY